MQYILDQNEYDEYKKLKSESKYPIEKPDELMSLLKSGHVAIDVRQINNGYKEQYEVMMKVDLNMLPDNAIDYVMSRVRRY